MPPHSFNLSSSSSSITTNTTGTPTNTTTGNTNNKTAANVLPINANNANNSISSQTQSQIPISMPNQTTLSPFLAAAAAAAKGFLHPSHPFHQINNRLLNVPFLPPNPLASSNQMNNNSCNLLISNSKTINSNDNSINSSSSNTRSKEMITNENETTNLKDNSNLHSNAPLHLQPFLRSLSAAAAAAVHQQQQQQSNDLTNNNNNNKFSINPLLPANFSMLPQSMHQLLHPFLANNLDAAMLNQSSNQINHSLNSNSSLISTTSSTSSSPVPFNCKSQNGMKLLQNRMTTNDLLNKLSKADLNHSLNINVEDDEDCDILENEFEGEELDIDSNNDFDQSMEKNESCLSNEELSERETLSKSINKESINDLDMRSRSPQTAPNNNLPSLQIAKNLNGSNLILNNNNNNNLLSKPVAVHPLKNFSSDNLANSIAVSLANSSQIANQRTNLLPTSSSSATSTLLQPHLTNTLNSTSSLTNTTNTTPFYNTSFLQHPLIPSAERTNSFCQQQTNPVWPFPFDSNAVAAAKLNFAQFFNNNNKQEAK